jgi:hypothetical protein
MSRGQDELHRFAQMVIGAFLVSTRREDLAEEAKAFLDSERCTELVNQFMGALVHAIAAEMPQERRRFNPFRRLLCHPLTELLESDVVSRALLPNYFNFLHLVLGDQLETLTQECEEILADVRRDPRFTWDMFYDDPRAKVVLWGVLIRIADAFKRFEPRRDWFIGLMQNRMHAVSLAPNAFVPLAHTPEDNQVTFGKIQFNLLFGALYRPLLNLSAHDGGTFTRLFGAPPVKLIAPLVEKLV